MSAWLRVVLRLGAAVDLYEVCSNCPPGSPCSAAAFSRAFNRLCAFGVCCLARFCAAVFFVVAVAASPLAAVAAVTSSPPLHVLRVL